MTSIVLDYAADIAPRLHVQSDGAGSYLNSSNLASQIQPVGDWEVDAKTPKNATRQIYLDFSQPVPGSAPNGQDPIGPPSGNYAFRIIAKCSLYGTNLLNFPAGATKTCPLHIGFDYNGATWALQMDPLHAANGPFPETNWATVKCIFPTVAAHRVPSGHSRPAAPTSPRMAREISQRWEIARVLVGTRRADDCQRSWRLLRVVLDDRGEVRDLRP